MQIIVGLGNPGKKYTGTLHNAGALVLDRVAEDLGQSFAPAPKNIPAYIAHAADVLLVKPTTFMNVSGRAVQQMLAYYKLTPANLVVVYDDIDLLLGDVRVSAGGGAGGHNGIRSIIESLGGEKAFGRIRIGVATPATAQKKGRSRDVARIVLKKPRLFDRAAFAETLRSGADEVLRAIR